MKTPHGLACGEAALTLQRKGKKAWQVKVCLALFFVGNMKDSSRMRSRPTAPWARAEKKCHRCHSGGTFGIMYQSLLIY